jgi:hypothetical protein
VKHLNPHNFVVLNGFNVSVNITESYCLLNFLLIAQKSRQTLYQFQLYLVVPIENFLKWQEILNILLAVLKAVVRCSMYLFFKSIRIMSLLNWCKTKTDCRLDLRSVK